MSPYNDPLRLDSRLQFPNIPGDIFCPKSSRHSQNETKSSDCGLPSSKGFKSDLSHPHLVNASVTYGDHCKDVFELPDPEDLWIPLVYDVEFAGPMADLVNGPPDERSIDLEISQPYEDFFNKYGIELDDASIEMTSKHSIDLLQLYLPPPSQDEQKELGLGFLQPGLVQSESFGIEAKKLPENSIQTNDPQPMDVDDCSDVKVDNENSKENVVKAEVPTTPPSGVPGLLDVKTGNCKTLHKLPGNVELRKFVEAHYDDYEMVKGNTAATTEFYQAIQRAFGGRFWKEEDGSWVEMNQKDIHVTMTNRFRGITRMRNREKKSKRKKQTEASGTSSKRPKTNKKPNTKKGQRTI